MGGQRGLTECQQQFKNEIWNCSLENKNVKHLPIFVKTTLTYGKTVLLFLALECETTDFHIGVCSRLYIKRVCSCHIEREQCKKLLSW